jgi:Sec7-like guanine-nucleotide exchange factor
MTDQQQTKQTRYQVQIETADCSLETLISYNRKDFAKKAAKSYGGIPGERSVSVYDRKTEQEIFNRKLAQELRK